VQCIYIKADKRDPKAAPIYAANGQPIKLDTHVFDIDMSLCCYCNLCTYPCPTNCIYMTPEYEFAATDLTSHLYHFAKPNAKFLTVNPKPPAPRPAVAAAAPGAPAPAARPAMPATPVAPGAPTPVAPSPGTAPKEPPPVPGDPANPAPNIATGTPPRAGGDTAGSGDVPPPEAVDPEASKARRHDRRRRRLLPLRGDPRGLRRGCGAGPQPH